MIMEAAMGRHPKSAEVRGRFWTARASGATLREATNAAGVSKTAGHYWLKESGGVRPRPKVARAALRLSLVEREEISRELAKGHTMTSIAALLGRSVSTVSREVARNTTASGAYRAVRADRMALARTRRPRPSKLAGNTRLREEVEEALKTRWSPQQISARLKVDFADDPSMQVSHETIYTSLYVQAKAGLPGQLSVHLRTRRVRRRPHRRVAMRPARIVGMVPLRKRPTEVNERVTFGHWEGDLIVGRNGLSHMGTLVDRLSRYTLLLHLPSARTDDVIAALTATIQRLPVQLRGTVTWDQGIEMTRHARFTRDTGVPIYFCDPRSPWQRGLNENTNGLLRQYFPKGSDLSMHTKADLVAVTRQLNNRPRRALKWQTPHEVLTSHVALTV
jgi:IS30 family transposase